MAETTRRFHRRDDGGARRRSRPGSSPGVIRTPEGAPPPKLHLIAYDATRIEERSIERVEELRPFLDAWSVVWLNVDGLGDADTLHEIGELFQLHPLALEDVSSLHQRPKVEPYENSVYLVMRQPHIVDEETIASEQVSLFLGAKFVLTFQEYEGDSFEPVRQRIRNGRPRLRNGGADYLAYALTDALIDTHFPILEHLSDRIESLEEFVISSPTPDVVPRIYGLKRQLMVLRRSTWPLRDAIGSLLRSDEIDLVQDETRIFFRDCQDHAVQIVELVENYRETATSLLDVYLSSLSNRMNEVMKVLTIIATIFIPLGFIAGVYGMNFDTESGWNMPELAWRFGYPAVIIFMVGIALALLAFFRRKRWIGPP